jgi:precorrin-4 methylase
MSKTALQVNAIVGLASAAVAAAMMSLMLTRPEAVATAIAQREYGRLAMAVATEVTSWLHALLRFI